MTPPWLIAGCFGLVGVFMGFAGAALIFGNHIVEGAERMREKAAREAWLDRLEARAVEVDRRLYQGGALRGVQRGDA